MLLKKKSLSATSDKGGKAKKGEGHVVAKHFRFQIIPSDIKVLAADNQAFKTLQRSLQQRKCMTNTYLTQSLHHYVIHVKDTQKARETSCQDKETEI